jgi:hypothetical protein
LDNEGILKKYNRIRALGIGLFTLGFVSIIGNFLDIEFLYRFGGHGGMSNGTGTGFIMIAGALLWLSQEVRLNRKIAEKLMEINDIEEDDC